MIRVRLADATINVGGNFHEKKDAIKATGARWNAQTKMWESSKALKDWFITPYDIEQGNDAGDHITKYGTHYSQAEWSAMQATNKAKAEISEQFQPKRDALKHQLRERLTSIGLTESVINRLAPIIQKGDLEYQVECGRIQFSTPERAQQVGAIEEWYGEAIGRLTLDELDAQNAAEERLADAFGMY